MKPLILPVFQSGRTFKSAALPATGRRTGVHVADPTGPHACARVKRKHCVFTILALYFLVEYGVSVPIDSDDVNDGDYVLENEPNLKLIRIK